MTSKELFDNHDRDQIQNYSAGKARTAFTGSAVLCRVLGRYNLYVDPKNYDMSPWLMLDGYWESWITLAIGRAVQKGWHCVDLGSWCGYYTVLMGDLVGPAGRVLAVEPNPTHHEMCRLSALSNGHCWTECLNVAAYDQESNLPFILTDGGGSRLGLEGTVHARTRTLDSMVADWPKVDLIKMDIEGAEEAAWLGMQEILARSPGCIVVLEWEPARYQNAEKFADSLMKFAPLRQITTDGCTAQIDKAAILGPDMRMLWLQK